MAFPDCQELCFDKTDFEKDDFSVDNFLDNRGTNFETLRDDLGRYLKELRSAMIELINQDYSDFVNLSSNLIGLDKSILKLKVPLGQFKEEILQVKCSLDEGIDELSQQLDTRQELVKSKESLKNLRTLLDLMDKMEALLKENHEVNMTRISAQLSQSEVCKTSCSILSNELIERHKRLEKEVYTLIDGLLMSLLASDRLGHDKEHRTATLDCLKIYSSLNQHQHVEELVQNQVIKPILKPLMNEQSAKSASDLYNKLLLILNEKSSALNLLINLTNECEEIKKFDFLTRSFWPEACSSLLGIHSLFSPGHPNEFYQKYIETLKFLAKIEAQLVTKKRIDEFRAREDYLKFTKKWNLIVYYQIRFQEIAGSLEKALVDSKQFDKAEAGSTFELNAVNATWNCVAQCFAAGIFLPQLLHKFWKLTLQLLARTYGWSQDIVGKNEKSEFLSVLHADLRSLCSKIPEIINIVEAAYPVSPKIKEALEENLKECRQNFESVLLKIVDKIVSLGNTKDEISKSVTDIPRIYRRTNRGVPSSAGPYMDKFLRAVNEINSSSVFQSKFSDKERSNIILKMVNNIAHVYLKAVQELLTSVQKTEDSLRKLKQIRDKSSASGQSLASGSQSVSDDDKIRLQIQQDVKHLTSEIKKLGIKDGEVVDIKELHAVVEKSLGTPK